MDSETLNIKPLKPFREIFSDCPGCDRELNTQDIELDQEIVCPHCEVVLLWVQIDGIRMFLRDGWT